MVFVEPVEALCLHMRKGKAHDFARPPSRSTDTIQPHNGAVVGRWS